MPIIAVFAQNLQDFEWIGDAPDVKAALAALVVDLSALAFDPSEFQGIRVYEVNEDQANALIDWWGGGPDPDGFPTDLPARLVVSEADLDQVFQDPEALARDAIRW